MRAKRLGLTAEEAHEFMMPQQATDQACSFSHTFQALTAHSSIHLSIVYVVVGCLVLFFVFFQVLFRYWFPQCPWQLILTF